jgi:diaminopropionate ammonia-lyase family
MSTIGRRPIYTNKTAATWISSPSSTVPTALIKHFHQTLPDFAPTRLFSLPALATELGVKEVLVKDETSRLGLPAFKVLGASWGTYRALIQFLGLGDEGEGLSFEDVGTVAREKGVVLFTATDGNHGRAVARMASLMGIRAQIFVPKWLDQPTRDLIASEGARINEVPGGYDDTVLAAAEEAAREAMGLLVQDHAFGDYSVIPQVCYLIWQRSKCLLRIVDS